MIILTRNGGGENLESTTYTVNGQEFELQHHGVKGMKWGKRKNSYVTVRQGLKNARAAGRDAWEKATIESGGKLVGKSKSIVVYKNPVAKMRGKVAARKAYTTAARESMKADKARNAKTRTKGKTSVDRTLKKVGNNTVSNAARTNQYLSGMRAITSLLNGNVVGAAYYGRRSNMYRDTKEFWM